MYKFKLLALSALITLSLAACGGGSGAGGTATNNESNGSNGATATVVKGVASKGPIDGKAKIYALNADGSKGSLLSTADVISGVYEANIGSYTGPVIIEVTGSYKDEATGNTISLDPNAPLRAAVSGASGTVSTAVTPLTELAVRKAGALTPSNIDTGNKLVSEIFKIDIINTMPVQPTSDALGKPGVTQSQKDYTLALAAISQLSMNRSTNGVSEPVADTLASLAYGITSGGMSDRTIRSFKEAVTDINRTDAFRNVSSTNLAYVGTITATYKLTISGPTDMAANAIKGIQFEIVIPAGLTLRNDPATGIPLSGIVNESKPASNQYVYSKFTSASNVLAVGLIASTGIGTGDLATITCDILPGWTAPPASSFSVKNNINAVGVDDKGNVTTLADVEVKVN